MVINSEYKQKKLQKFLLPNKFRVVTTFLSVLDSDEAKGLVVYGNSDCWVPFEFSSDIMVKSKHNIEEDIIEKKIIKKSKTYQELIDNYNKFLSNEKKYIKKAKANFYENFETSCDVEHLKNIYDISLEEKEVVLTKYIICVTKGVENIERIFKREGFVCRVVPFSKITSEYENKRIKEYVLDYFFDKEL